MSGEQAAACPHCGVAIEPLPKANRKCPECREWIRVRRDGATPLLLTDEDAAEFDAERERAWEQVQQAEEAWRRAAAIGMDDRWEEVEAKLAAGRGQEASGWREQVADIDRRLDEILDSLGPPGTPAREEARRKDPTVRDLQEQRNKVRREGASDEGQVAPGDVFWSLSNMALQEAMERENWQRLASIYHTQAGHLRDEGREFVHLLTESMRCQVRQALEETSDPDGLMLEVLGCRPDCDVCAPDAGRHVSAVELLSENPPVPHAECERCACTVMRSL